METYNAGDENAVADKEKDNKSKREQELEDIKTLMNMPVGIRFFKRFMEEGRVFHTSFTGNSQTFFLEGHRNLALKFLNDIREAAPQKIVELMIVEEEK